MPGGPSVVLTIIGCSPRCKALAASHVAQPSDCDCRECPGGSSALLLRRERPGYYWPWLHIRGIQRYDHYQAYENGYRSTGTCRSHPHCWTSFSVWSARCSCRCGVVAIFASGTGRGTSRTACACLERLASHPCPDWPRAFAVRHQSAPGNGCASLQVLTVTTVTAPTDNPSVYY
jgi:hypothetical protein